MARQLKRIGAKEFLKAGAATLAVFIVVTMLYDALVGPPTDITFTQDELHDFARPAVLRILGEHEGVVEIPRVQYEPDEDAFGILSGPPATSAFRVYSVQSGLILNPEGLVATSGGERIKRDIVARILERERRNILAELPEEIAFDIKRRNRILERAAVFAAERAAVTGLTVRRVALDPLMRANSPREAMDSGMPLAPAAGAEDVTLLTLPEGEYPALRVAGEDAASGEQTFIFDFAASPEEPGWFEESQVFHSSRLIGASLDGGLPETLSLNETSAGGPVISRNGTAVGLVGGKEGTGFIEGEILQDIIENPPQAAVRSIAARTEEGAYQKKFREGLVRLRARQCDTAIGVFEAAAEAESIYSLEGFVGDYISRCQELINDGLSRDTIRGKINAVLDGLGFLIWILLAATFAVVLMIARTSRKIVGPAETGDKSPPPQGPKDGF